MQVSKTYSVRNAKKILSDKKMIENLHTLLSKYESNEQLKDNPKVLKDYKFKPEVVIPVDGLNPRFDAYREDLKIGVELEKREQMHVRSHLLFTEIAYQKNFIDLAVFILPINGNNANFNRCLKELTQTELFSENFFKLEVPLYVMGYS